jgi:5'-nucleotidase (lipoprotein e(P4) family)
MKSWAWSCGLLLAVAGCRSAGMPAVPGPASPAPSAAPSAGPTLSTGVHWYRNSAEQRAAYLQAYRWATARVEARSAGKHAGQWAVVADADETLLDNSTYQKERELAGLAFDAQSWTAWVARREARALPGSVAFLERVGALGGRVAVVTNRTVSECPDTEANLRTERLAFDVLLCKPDGGASEKDSRFRRVQDGTAQEGVPPLEIVLFVGDNIQDFPELKQDSRADLARLAGFGEQYIVLPNPMYGSWERNPRQ